MMGAENCKAAPFFFRVSEMSDIGNRVLANEKFTMFKKSRYFGVTALVVLAVLCWGIFKLLSPQNFGTPKLMSDYLQTSIQYAVGGCGFYFIVVMGLFDFSIGANIVLSSMVGVLLSRHLGYIGLIGGTLLTGALIGAFNGVFYSKLKIPSMIVTVGLMLILESVANYVVKLDTSGFPGKLTNSSILAFNHAPWNYIVAFAAFFLMVFILRFTRI